MSQLKNATLFVIAGIIIVYVADILIFISNLMLTRSYGWRILFQQISFIICQTAFKMPLLYYFLILYRKQ